MAAGRSRKEHHLEDIDGPSVEDQRPDEANRPAAWDRMSAEERAEFDRRWGTGREWGQEPKTSSTDGRIVGKCDHCGEPVRYHTEGGGHLRHLHNNSARCSDGKVSTAMICRQGGLEYRFPVQAAMSGDFFRAVPQRGGQCDFCGADATHTLHHVDGETSRMNQIGRACSQHAKEYDSQPARVAASRREGAVLENPTSENPTGKGDDPYRARTEWQGFETQRPRQPMEGEGGMNANTPTSAPNSLKAKPNFNTPQPGLQKSDQQDEDEDQEEDDDDDE